MSYPKPVPTYHTTTYPALDPTLPTLSTRDKNIIITGAGSGIGRAIALSFARANASNIAILGRRLPQLEETKHLIAAQNSQSTTHIFTADITSLPSLQSAFTKYAEAINGPIDILIANAGWHPGVGPVSSFSTETFSSSLTINVIGAANSLQAWHPHKPATGGKVVHTSSAVAHLSLPKSSAYSVAKTAAARMMEFYAVENPDTQVIGFHPGVVATEMLTGRIGKGMGLEADTECESAGISLTLSRAIHANTWS